MPSPSKRAPAGHWAVNGALLVLCVLWLLPTLGLLISSIRTPDDIQQSGWWTIFPHGVWETVETFVPDSGLDRGGVMEIRGVSATLTSSATASSRPTDVA